MNNIEVRTNVFFACPVLLIFYKRSTRITLLLFPKFVSGLTNSVTGLQYWKLGEVKSLKT